jgi:lysine 2,3-aminomutase
MIMPEKKSKKKTASPSTTKSDYKTFVQTRTIDDVFTDAVDMVKPKFEADYRAYLERLWEANPDLQKCLQQAADLEAARNVVFDYLEKTERDVFGVDNDLHILEKSTVRESIRVLRALLAP